MICGIDVGTTKVCALIAALDEHNGLRVVGAGRVPSQGLRKGVVVNVAEATAAIGQAVAEAEQSAGQTMNSAYVGIAGGHVTAIGSRGVVAAGRSGKNITKEDIQRSLEQARNIALPHNKEIIHAVPRTFSVDDQKGILDPTGMFGYRLEVDASIIVGASSAVTNLVNCVQANGVAIDDLVLQPLASGEAVLTSEERQAGVALIDIGGGTSDLAIYLDGAPWHTVVTELAGDYLTKDVAVGLRMPYSMAEALIKQHGHVLPDQVSPDAEVRSGAFGQDGQQTINCRLLAEILHARVQDFMDMIVLEVKRSGYDGLLPAGIVLTGGVAQLSGLAELSRSRLQWHVRIGRPPGYSGSVIDVTTPDYATVVGLLEWGLKRGTVVPRPVTTPRTNPFDRVWKWLRALLPV